jgi:hypothetical protein
MSHPFRRACLLAAWLLPAAALATPQVLGEGPLDLRIDYDQQTKAALDQRAIKLGEPLKLIVSLRVPDLPKGVKAELILAPLDADLSIEGQLGATYKGVDSAVEPEGILIGLDLSNQQPKTRMTFTVNLRPRGKAGSGIKATVRKLGGGSTLGFAGRTFAADAEGKLRAVTFRQLADEQHQALTKEVGVQRKVLLADQALPFDEKLFEKALETPSEKVELFNGGDQ